MNESHTLKSNQLERGRAPRTVVHHANFPRPAAGPWMWEGNVLLSSRIHWYLFNWITIDKQYCISFRYSDSLFSYIIITTVGLVTICHHTELLQYYWLYSLCCTLHLSDLFHSWKFVPFNPLHKFCLPEPPLSGNHQSHQLVYELRFLGSCTVFLDSAYRWNRMVFVFLTYST